MRQIYVVKNSGEIVPFSAEKYKRSLRKAGASEEIVSEVLDEMEDSILYDGIATAELYEKTSRLLEKKKDRVTAGRYNLKRALLRFGPSGYPFEKFVASLLRHKGYKTKEGKILPGRCVKHEVDVLAEKDGKRIMVECKFHNNAKYRSNVKVSLYVQSRFEDINAYYKMNKDNGTKCDESWIVTNTKFTKDAIDYAECVGIKVLSWGYPKKESLEHIIESHGWHPISCLTKLTKQDINILFKNDIVVCDDLFNNLDLIKKLKFSESKVESMLTECKAFLELVK